MTIKRSKSYINAGADMIFPEGLENLDGKEYFKASKHNYY
jgi:2-methylisocitrate lyase-like PEP mutase family enzyme